MTTTIFIHHGERGNLSEGALPASPTGIDLEWLLRSLNIDLDDTCRVLLDEEDEPLDLTSKAPLKGLKSGCRIHVTRCLRVRVTVNYLERTAHETFAGGARVRRVKAWAVREFELKEQDAIEHLLQLCNSEDRPTTDTPLHELTKRGDCAICFDLVPEKRVEG